ncbi:MAG: TAT-variant-translocated molybdopterin oxidoreductase [Candidatus Acidiferrales bacterium]
MSSKPDNPFAMVPLKPAGPAKIDIAAVREKLAAAGGKHFWRSLEELAGTQEYHDFLQHEFPYDPAKEARPEGVSRRDVLKLVAASAAFAGLSSCTKLPVEKIVPYVRQPEEIIPGRPLFYATSMPQGGVGVGVLVESHMGRPTKIEGNPEHPGSLGGTDVFAQASILTLYDPDRSQVIVHEGRISDWPAFLTAAANARQQWMSTKGEGLRILTGPVTSPTLASQIQGLLQEFPLVKWHQYTPCARDNAREGAKLAFGRYANTVYRFDQADVVLSLDADFLTTGPGHVRYAKDFMARRDVDGPKSVMNRLYAVESAPSNAGTIADHRLPMRAQDIGAFAKLLAARLGILMNGAMALPSSDALAKWVNGVAADLERHRGACLVVAGEYQPPYVHALAHALNAALGNVGKTVMYTDALEAYPENEMNSLSELASDMGSGRVTHLVILGGNPVYDAPWDFNFQENYLKVRNRIHLGLYFDETAELSHWHIPEAHFLEAWSDVRAYDGTIGIVQPLIEPLYDGKSAHEMIAPLGAHPDRTAHDTIQDHWKAQRPEKDFTAFWETTLHDGIMAGSALPAISVTPNLDSPEMKKQLAQTSAASGLEIVFRPDPTIGDGQESNNGWLQELPKPISHLTWDNVAMMSPKTAGRLGLATTDAVKLTLEGRQVIAPVWISPGHADDSVTVHFGYGRWRSGRVGTGIGFNAYNLRSSAAPWMAAGLVIEKTGETWALATTQHHNLIATAQGGEEEESVAAFDRDLIRVGTLEEFKKNPAFAQNPEDDPSKNISLYPGYKYEGYAWGMAVDLNRCMGCAACVVACQAENNISVVGKDEVMRGRAMHWIRVDSYFHGGLENPETYHEPVMCQHCENAPCEVVCPVGATVHSAEGLNVMVYNRCVGTRYCSNNCPYKVRRFNFKLYSDWTSESLYGLRNPNVSVRSRGVMEKCSYCLQRINAAKIRAEEEDRSVRDGEIVTACQGACPADAIVFGNINDPASRVSKLKAQPRNYGLLTDLNTRPRTTYLARVRNPNPEMPE